MRMRPAPICDSLIWPESLDHAPIYQERKGMSVLAFLERNPQKVLASFCTVMVITILWPKGDVLFICSESSLFFPFYFPNSIWDQYNL